MREIKFRAWDKDRKRFLRCIVGNTDINDDKWICPLTYCEVNGVYDWYNNDTCEIMQYTGIKDINDVEIYEGDIVGTIRYGGFNKNIMFKGIVIYDEDYCSFCVKYIKGKIYSPMYLCEVKVIGNIYENEELLEEIR